MWSPNYSSYSVGVFVVNEYLGSGFSFPPNQCGWLDIVCTSGVFVYLFTKQVWRHSTWYGHVPNKVSTTKRDQKDGSFTSSYSVRRGSRSTPSRGRSSSTPVCTKDRTSRGVRRSTPPPTRLRVRRLRSWQRWSTPEFFRFSGCLKGRNRGRQRVQRVWPTSTSWPEYDWNHKSDYYPGIVWRTQGIK